MNREELEHKLTNPSSKRRSLSREYQAQGACLSRIVLCVTSIHD
jgi:hypothetical protein